MPISNAKVQKFTSSIEKLKKQVPDNLTAEQQQEFVAALFGAQKTAATTAP
jgi:hypothetical protein